MIPYEIEMKSLLLQNDIFRVLIDERTPLKTRYHVQDALKGPVQPDT